MRARSRTRELVFLGVLPLLAAACGGHVADPSSLKEPVAYVLRVDRVEVSGTKHGSAMAWDGEETASDPGAGCKVLVMGAALFEPVLAPASAICDWSRDPPRQRHASDPDLQVRLGVGPDVSYTSWIMPDATSLAFGYEMLVPVEAIPADGIRLEVIDDDGPAPAEVVGGVRVSREQLMATYRSQSTLSVFSDGALQRLEVVVSAYKTVATERASTRARDRPTRVGRPTIAGELLSVTASGEFTVGSWYDANLDPSGYPGGEATSYNLASFKRAPHACAIALIGDGGTVEGVKVGTAFDFVAGHAGPLRLGLNDKDLSNNNGNVAYTVARGVPTAAQWLERGRMR